MGTTILGGFKIGRLNTRDLMKMERGFQAIFEVERAANFLMKNGKRILGDLRFGTSG